MSLIAQDRYPTLRKGIIIDASAELDSHAEKIVRKKLINKKYFNEIINLIENKLSDLACVRLELDQATRINVEIREGMVVNYPKFFLYANDNLCYEIKISNTMCVKPNHSKIWIRVSHSLEKDNSVIDIDDLDRFFSRANSISEAIELVVKDQYQNVLKSEHLGFELKEAYFIKIQTITDDLVKIESPLESKIFKFSDYFGSAMEYNSIKWILEKAHNRAIIDIGDYKNAIRSGNYEWFTLNTSGNQSSTGLYYKHHLSDQSRTELFGVMHSPRVASQQLESLSKNFSGALVRMTSPFI
jgi:hypothetical protein